MTNPQTQIEARCIAIADAVVPNYRNGKRAYSCTSQVARMWQAAYDGAAATLATPPASDAAVPLDESRFWLIVREPGMVPERKGSWPNRDIAKTLREFIALRPRAFIDVLTIGPDGTPDVDHGPELLQMLDGRSMSVGSKHNARVRAAAEEALAAAPKAASDTGAGLPRLTRAMMRAACKAHYGDDNIDGISLTADGHDYNFAQGFARMWKGIRVALATPTDATGRATGGGEAGR